MRVETYDHAAAVIAGESAAPRESSCEQPVTTVPDATEVEVLLAVVTYNSQDVVVDLLKGLPDALGSCSWRLVVADNDSQDSTIERVREMQPEARIVQMGRNAGYAAGINAAIVAGGRARSVLVLNPDTRLDPGSIPIMLRRLQRPGVGIVVPRLLDSDRALVETLRREPNIRRALGDTILTARRAGRFPTWGELVTDRDCYVRETGADWAAGPAMLISRECLDACGGWDESFFLYSEETEFCLRARDHGYQLLLTPDAEVVHLGGESQISPNLRALLVVNRVQLYSRGRPAPATFVFWLIAVIREASRVVVGHRESRRALAALLSSRRARDVTRAAAGLLPDLDRRRALAQAANTATRDPKTS